MRHVLVSAALFSALSCSDSSGPGIRGSLAFTYTGAGGGTFSASGDAPPLSAPPPGTSWVVGYVQANESFVASSTPRSGGLIDLALLATIGEREVLMELDPRAFFFTEHYRNYPAVLVRLAEVAAPLLSDVVTESWRHVSVLPPRRPRKPAKRGGKGERKARVRRRLTSA